MRTTREQFGPLLVPLDGSDVAERALGPARRVALATESTIILARVTPMLTWQIGFMGTGNLTPDTFTQLLDEEDRASQVYLDVVAKRLRAQRCVVVTMALRGDPANTLIAQEERNQVGLVVMTTHGRTGLARFALGSVADRLVCGGVAAVLLLRSFGDNLAEERLSRALVPLDGSRDAENALAFCMQLAGRLLYHVRLVGVSNADDAVEHGAMERYLAGICAREEANFQAMDCALDTVALAGDVGDQIVRCADRDRDVIVMATHGRSGAMRLALGSVADRVVQAATLPVLLVRPARRHHGA